MLDLKFSYSCAWRRVVWYKFLLVGWDLRHQVLRTLLAYCTAPNDRWGWLWSNWWNEDWQGKPKYSEKTYSSAILSTTNPTWPDPCANPGRRGGKPATNRLSYGAAYVIVVTSSLQGRVWRIHWQNACSSNITCTSSGNWCSKNLEIRTLTRKYRINVTRKRA
jgi:hypothetical protein